MNSFPPPPPENLIRPFGYSTSDCGYCKGQRASLLPGNVSPNDSSKSWGMLADVLTPSSYEELIARGWRRSGIHLYNPCNFESCCPTLTIRLLTFKFQMTKSQTKVMRKMQNLLSPLERKTQKKKRSSASEVEQLISSSGVLTALSQSTKQALMQCLPNGHNANQNWVATFKTRKQSKQERKQHTAKVVSSICAEVAGKMSLQRQTLVQSVVQTLFLPSNNDFGGLISIVSTEAHEPSGQIIVTLQLLASDMPIDDTVDESMRVEEDDKLGDWYTRTVHQPLLPDARQITVETMTAHESALDPRVFRLYSLYQHVVHDDPDPFSTEQRDNPNNNEPPVPLSELDWGNAPKFFLDQVESMLNQFCQNCDNELKNSILSNYYSFYQFLVEGPFPFNNHQQTTPMRPPSCGNYHQHYKIGDFLIAVGVVDILPTGLSSVYLFYDPSFSHQLVALGKYAILKEVEYTHKELNLPYYYLGYYIQSCQKMRYKAEYKPSQLLCPKYYKWVDAEVALGKLRQTPRHVCPFVDSNDDEENGHRNLDHLLDLVQMDIGAGLNVTFNMLQDSGKQVVKPILEEFVEKVGPKLCTACLVKLS